MQPWAYCTPAKNRHHPQLTISSLSQTSSEATIQLLTGAPPTTNTPHLLSNKTMTSTSNEATWVEKVTPFGTFATPVSVEFGVTRRTLAVMVSPIVTKADCRGMIAGAAPSSWTPKEMQLLLALVCRYSPVQDGGAKATIVYPAIVDMPTVDFLPSVDLGVADITPTVDGHAACPILIVLHQEGTYCSVNVDMKTPRHPTAVYTLVEGENCSASCEDWQSMVTNVVTAVLADQNIRVKLQNVTRSKKAPVSGGQLLMSVFYIRYHQDKTFEKGLGHPFEERTKNLTKKQKKKKKQTRDPSLGPKQFFHHGTGPVDDSLKELAPRLSPVLLLCKLLTELMGEIRQDDASLACCEGIHGDFQSLVDVLVQVRANPGSIFDGLQESWKEEVERDVSLVMLRHPEAVPTAASVGASDGIPTAASVGASDGIPLGHAMMSLMVTSLLETAQMATERQGLLGGGAQDEDEDEIPVDETFARPDDESAYGITEDELLALRTHSSTLSVRVGAAVDEGLDSVSGINTFAASAMQSVAHGIAPPTKARAFSEDIDPIYAALETQAGEAKGAKNEPMYPKANVPLEIETGRSDISCAELTFSTIERTTGDQAMEKICGDEVSDEDDEEAEIRSFRMDDALPNPPPVHPGDLFCHQSQKTQNSDDDEEDDDEEDGKTAGSAADEVPTKSGTKRKKQKKASKAKVTQNPKRTIRNERNREASATMLESLGASVLPAIPIVEGEIDTVCRWNAPSETMEFLPLYEPLAETDVGHVPMPPLAENSDGLNGIPYYYAPAQMSVCPDFKKFANLKEKGPAVLAASQFRLGSMDFGAPEDIAEEASQAICQLFKIPSEDYFIFHRCPYCPRRFRSYTDWLHHIQWTRYGQATPDFTCERAEMIRPVQRYVHSGHLVHYISHRTLKMLRNTILSAKQTWGMESPPVTYDLLDPLGIPSIDYNCEAIGGDGVMTKRENKVRVMKDCDLMKALGRMEEHEIKTRKETPNKGRPGTYPPISAYYSLQFVKRRESWPMIPHRANADAIPSRANVESWTHVTFRQERGLDAPTVDLEDETE